MAEDPSLFIAKLLGLYFLIVGLIFIMRRRSIMPVIAEFAGSRALVFLVAVLELGAGIALAIGHTIWTPDYRGIITLIGWWLIVEGAIYLFTPITRMARLVAAFNSSGWYVSGGLTSMLLGAYLAGVGFGLIPPTIPGLAV